MALILLLSGCAAATKDVSTITKTHPQATEEELQKDKEKLEETKDLLKY